jgi:hypothetical protein
MKRQTLKMNVGKQKPVIVSTRKTKATAVATSTSGGTITLKGTRS